MNRIVVAVPAMYGDHHVNRVRDLLLDAAGVTGVTASAARRRVAVEFDETSTSAEKIEELLASSGYPSQAAPVEALPKRHEDGSGWYLLPERMTRTERKDREMAGDFRRY